MFRQILGDLYDEIYAAYFALVMWLLGLIALTLVMFLLNVAGLMGANLLIFFAGGLAILLATLAPKMILIALGLGATVQALRDEDITQGSIRGVVVLYHIATGILLWFWIIAGFLATWSFELAPKAFFLVAAASFVIAALYAHYNIRGGRWVRFLVLLYAVTIIVTALWSTFSSDARNRVLKPFGSSTSDQSTASRAPRVYTTRSGQFHLRQGEEATIALTRYANIGISTTDCVHYTPRVNGRPLKGGHWCGRPINMPLPGNASHHFEAKYGPTTISWRQ